MVHALDEELFGGVAGPLWVLLGAVGVVLLIACANVANLFAVRAERRQRDIAVRRALGAGRARLVRAQMAEAAVVAAAAGVLAVALAALGVPVFLSAAPPAVPRLDQASVTATTLLFTFAAALLSSLLFGLVPAVRASAPNMNRLRVWWPGGPARSACVWRWAPRPGVCAAWWWCRARRASSVDPIESLRDA